MPWIQLKINTEEEHAEKIGDMLSANGAQAVTFMDAKDTPIYEPEPGTLVLWPRTQVIGLFDAEHNMQAVITRLSQANVLGENFKHKLDQLEDKDWEREWMDNFHPMQFGERVWICPSWCDVPDPGAVNIMLDPGLAFGTGTHPTTSLCLQWLDGIDLQGKVVVDYGCGSGILAIAALLLGAEKAIGVDIDPQALIASKENARRNGVAEKLELFLPEHQPKCEADIVLANILAGPLLDLRDVITGYCKPGGLLAMSGILEVQAQRVAEAYSPDFTLEPVVCENEWARVYGTRN